MVRKPCTGTRNQFGQIIGRCGGRKAKGLELGRLADNFDCVWVVLTLTKHQLVRVEPANLAGKRVELDKDNLRAVGKDLKVIGVRSHGRAAKVFGRDWNDCLHGKREESPNDPKLSDSPGWRDRCVVGERRRQEAAGVTAGRVRCSAWLGPG